MKIKFIILTCLLLFARGCDFYSTSLWFFQPGGKSGETNPLTSVFDFGFTGLLLSNAVIIGFIIYAFYCFSFKYKVKKLEAVPPTLTDYVSEIYYNERGQFYKVFFKSPTNKKILVAHLGYVLVRVVIFASFLATFHNLCQYYNIQFYNTFREIVKRPLFVIYGLIALSFFFFQFQLFNKEYKNLKQN